MPQGDNNQALLENTYRSSFGLNKNIIISSSVESGVIPEGYYCALQVLSETAEFRDMIENGSMLDGYEDITYSQGFTVYGFFTGGIVVSGVVKMYGFNPVIS
jgi:hypothetical protein